VSFEIRYLSPVIGPALFTVALIISRYRLFLGLLRKEDAH